jgi:hypothetical protein
VGKYEQKLEVFFQHLSTTGTDGGGGERRCVADYYFFLAFAAATLGQFR